jgi:hypothetical protein
MRVQKPEEVAAPLSSSFYGGHNFQAAAASTNSAFYDLEVGGKHFC